MASARSAGLPSPCAPRARRAFACDSASMTGPTSVSRRSGSPSPSSAMAPAIRSSTVSAMSCCTNSTRRAEQRWPALSKAEVTASCTSCSGSAVESAIIAFSPPVSAMNGTIGPSRAASWRLMSCATSVEPVKATPATRGSRTSAPPISAPGAGHEVQHLARDAGFVQQAHGRERDERRLFRGLRDDGIAGGERAGDLAGEDRHRKVPRADAGEDAAAVQRDLVALAGRPGQRLSAPRTPRARGARSSAGNRRPRARPRRRSRPSCRPRARRGPTSSAISRSKRSAARSRIAARSRASQRVPARLRGQRGGDGAIGLRRRRVHDVPRLTRRRSAGSRTGSPRPSAASPRDERPRRRALQPSASAISSRNGTALRRIAQQNAARVRAGPDSMYARQRDARMRLGLGGARAARPDRRRCPRSAPRRRRGDSRRRYWRRSRAGGARDRRAGPRARRPARRSGRATPSPSGPITWS